MTFAGFTLPINTMKAAPLLLMTVMASCVDIRPLPLPETVLQDTTVSVAPPSCPDLDKHLSGVWLYTSNHLINFKGGSQSYSGHITLNNDGTMNDPDTLFGNTIGNEPIIRKEYFLDGGLLYLFVADRLERQLGVIMRPRDNQCDKPTFINTESGPVRTELTR